MEQNWSDSLSRRTATAAQWRFGLSASQAVLQFGVGIVLARLLPPEDFGLLALALIITGFARFASNLGLAPAVIQRKELTVAHVRVAFTLSVVAGIAVAGALYLLAPLSAPLFQNDRVPDILRLVAVIFVIAGIGNTAGALLRRNLAFRTIFWIGNASYVLGYGLVSVSFALAGFGVWSLVLGMLAQEILDTILLYAVTRHPVKPLLARDSIRELTSYGVGFTLGGFAEYLGRTGDNFVIGRWLGSHSLGIYNRAYSLMMLPQDYVSGIIQQVLFPAFSEVQEDRQRLGSVYLLAVQLVTLLAAPVSIGMIVAAPHMIVGLYGEKWAATVVPLQILCAVGWLRALIPLANTVAHSTGNVYRYFWRACGYCILVLGGAFVGTRWGVSGVACAVAVSVVLMYLTMAELSIRLLPFSWVDFWQAQSVGMTVGCVVGAAALGVRLVLEQVGAGHLLQFGCIVATCAVTLAGAIHWLPDAARPDELFRRLGEIANRWPDPVGAGLRSFLRLDGRAP